MTRTSYETSSGTTVTNIVEGNARVGFQGGDLYAPGGLTINMGDTIQVTGVPETFNDRLEDDPLLSAAQSMGGRATEFTGVHVAEREHPSDEEESYSYVDDDGTTHNVATGGNTLIQGGYFSPEATINGVPATEYFATSKESEEDGSTVEEPTEEKAPTEVEDTAPTESAPVQNEQVAHPRETGHISPTYSGRVTYNKSHRRGNETIASFGGSTAEMASTDLEGLRKDRLNLYFLTILDYFHTHLKERAKNGEDSEHTQTMLDLVEQLIARMKEPSTESLRENPDR